MRLAYEIARDLLGLMLTAAFTLGLLLSIDVILAKLGAVPI